MGKFLCDIKIDDEEFNRFKTWHQEKYPGFKGTIRKSTEMGVADIIDGSNLKRFRYAIL